MKVIPQDSLNLVVVVKIYKVNSIKFSFLIFMIYELTFDSLFSSFSDFVIISIHKNEVVTFPPFLKKTTT